MELFKVAGFNSKVLQSHFKEITENLLENLEKYWNSSTPEKWEPC